MKTAIRPIRDGLLQVKVPLPFPLRWVNSYVVKGSGGYTVIDPGLHTPESESLWQETLREWNISFANIEQIVLTHYHPDHYGLSGWFQERSGAPVRMSRLGVEQAHAMWGEGETLSRETTELFVLHGMDGQTAEQMLTHMKSFIPQVSPQPDVTPVEAGEMLRIGDREYLTIHTPGHASGHLCLYDAERKEIFCGDHVLPQITPNVSYIPGFDPNPLKSYLVSLDQMTELEVSQAYPGHREPFEAFGERAGEIIRHHHERLREMKERLAAPMSAFALCRALFGERLTIHQLRFALSETLAHLIHLREEEQVVELRTDGVVLYQAL